MSGGRTPDRRPGPTLEEDYLALEDRVTAPGIVGAIYRVGNDLLAEDGSGEFNLRSGSGLTEATHEGLDTLIHRIAQTSHLDIVRQAGKVETITYWTDSNKTTKIREIEITRTSGKVSEIVETQFDGLGQPVQTLTGTVQRTNGKVTTIDWVKA